MADEISDPTNTPSWLLSPNPLAGASVPSAQPNSVSTPIQVASNPIPSGASRNYNPSDSTTWPKNSNGVPFNPMANRSAISKAILEAESSGGQNVGTSSRGAVGPGQITPSTFAEYAKPGEDINNPNDNLAVHDRIIDDYSRRYNGDPARIAVAYFSGPGNVAPPGSPTPWINNSNDGSISVEDYVNKVTGKGGSPQSTHGLPQPPVEPSAQADSFKGLMQLALIQAAFPQHKFTPIDYDPWKVRPVVGGPVE